MGAREDEARKEAERQRRAQEAEEQRLREEEAARKEREAREQREAQEAAEKVEKKQKVDDFLTENRFADVNAKRKSKFGRYKFPLHTAVKHNPDLVPLLIEAGANP